MCDSERVKKTASSMNDAAIKQPAGKARKTPKAALYSNTARSGGIPRGIIVKEVCASYHVTQDTFTRLTGFSPRAVANWSQGRKPSESTGRRLVEVKRIFGALEELISPEAIGPWLKEPNPAFDGSTPLQVIERGEADRIWRMIYELKSGEPG
jgi:DNA-binding transcriptional regulator YiaG